MAAYIESQPLRAAHLQQEAQAKLDALNLEIQRLSTGQSSLEAASGSASGMGGNKRQILEDNEYVRESKEIVEGVRDAVKEGKMTGLEIDGRS